MFLSNKFFSHLILKDFAILGSSEPMTFLSPNNNNNSKLSIIPLVGVNYNNNNKQSLIPLDGIDYMNKTTPLFSISNLAFGNIV